MLGMVATCKGRSALRDFLPHRSDLSDALATIAYNLGIRRSLPARPRFNYVEKIEYWAMLIGALIMSLTGLMLIARQTLLRLLPHLWVDVARVIHYYEAVLATLAILVWHLYAVIFDPEQYPMNPAWLTGKRRWPGVDAVERAHTADVGRADTYSPAEKDGH